MIQVFVRHCYYSTNQDIPGRERPVWFDKEKVYNNLINTIDTDLAKINIIYDESRGSISQTFLKDTPAFITNAGSEPTSIQLSLDHIVSMDLDPETIIYFLEDDYVHRPGWCKIMLEAFNETNADYVTLYDHRDKYSAPIVPFNPYLLYTSSTHWTTVPYTTNTFAARFKTLVDDYLVHRECASEDVQKFVILSNTKQRKLISPLPGYSTHCQANYLSPTIDWETLLG